MSALILIRPAALVLLTQQCAMVSSSNPHLATVVEQVLLPVRTLQALGDLALSALGDDPPAAERLRLLLAAVATPFEIDHETAQQALLTPKKLAPSTTDPSGRESNFAWPSDALVDLGAVVILGLACIRAGVPMGLGSSLLGTLSGLVLATSPAEALLRWLRLAPVDAHFTTFLATFSATAEGRTGLYRTFARQLLVDQSERTRWRCVLAVFGKKGLQQDARIQTGWIAAHADGLQGLSIESGEDRYRLLGNFPSRTASAVVQVVVVGRRGILHERLVAEILEWTTTAIVVRIPGGLAGGWVGFSSSALVGGANKLRSSLRERWRTPPVPGLSDSVPVALIPLLPVIPLPPRVLATPLLQIIAVKRSGGEVTQPWQMVAGDHLRLVVTITSGGQPAWVWVDGGNATRTRVVGDRAVLSVPAALTQPGTMLTVMLAQAPQAEAIDQRQIGPLQKLRVQRVVLLLPTLVASGDDGQATDDQVVSTTRADAALAAAAGRVGIVIQRYRLPTVDDDLAVLYGPLGDAQDGRLENILAALQRTAVCTPGAEDALWLAVVPGRESWQRSLIGAAARLVAVATLGGVEAVLLNLAQTDQTDQTDQTSKPELKPAQEVLRLVGLIDGHGGIAWQSVRQEFRRLPQLAVATIASVRAASGPHFKVVILDAQGVVVHQQPLSLLASVHLAVLIPLPPASSAVEIRHRLYGSEPDAFPEATVARVVRPTSSLQLSSTLKGVLLQWQVSQADGLPEWLTLEAALAKPTQLGQTTVELPAPEPVWTILERWSACCHLQRQPLWSRYSLRGVTRLRLVADDGWHCVMADLSGPVPGTVQAMRIRRMSDGRLWADGPGTPSWSVAGAAVSRQRLLSVEHPAQVVLRMRSGSRMVRDHVAVALTDMVSYRG